MIRMFRLRVVGLIFVLIFCTSYLAFANSLFSSGSTSLYGDKRPRQIGDLVTIIIMENAQATNSTQTTTGKSANAAVGSKGVLSGISADVNIGDSSKNNEVTSRKGALVAKMTARVEEVLPNGDLMLTGSRTITVNNEKQTLTIRGIVRPQDITLDNTVSSGQVGNAEIRFHGSPDWQKQNGLIANTWEAVQNFFTWLF